MALRSSYSNEKIMIKIDFKGLSTIRFDKFQKRRVNLAGYLIVNISGTILAVTKEHGDIAE